MDWKDVVELFYIPNVTSTREKTQCPICMEPAPLMTTPRVTKCGHLYCWPCLLQYLAFEREYSWKKCPLCADPIYKHDIRRVTILHVDQDELQLARVTSMEEEEVKTMGFGKSIEFNLMIRNKSNINVMTAADNSNVILESRLPTIYDEHYRPSRIRVSDHKHIRDNITKDLNLLQANYKEKKRAKEDELLPFVSEAIQFCETQLAKKEGAVSDEEEPGFVSPLEQSRAKTQQATIS